MSIISMRINWKTPKLQSLNPKKRINIFLTLGFLLFSFQSEVRAGCKNLDPERCEILRNFTVFDQKNEIHFNHKCSKLGHEKHFLNAYAFFEKVDSDPSYRALALTQVLVGWVYGVSDFRGIGLRLQKLQLESLKEWAGDYFSFALKVKNIHSGNEATGDFSETFFSNGSDYKYKLSSTGDFDLERIIEREDKRSKNETLEGVGGVRIQDRKLDSLKDDLQLYFVIKNLNTGSFIELKGPVLRNLEQHLLRIKKPEFKSMNFIETFFTTQEGSYWEWLGHGRRYQNCIYLRKKAKKEFQERFSNLSSL